jgi:hypothetical protein
MKRISTGKARRLRSIIESNRCPRRPGITHRLRWTGQMVEEGFDYTRGGPLVPQMQCMKCGRISP